LARQRQYHPGRRASVDPGSSLGARQRQYHPGRRASVDPGFATSPHIIRNVMAGLDPAISV
jgi:hypothetical protein